MHLRTKTYILLKASMKESFYTLILGRPNNVFLKLQQNNKYMQPIKVQIVKFDRKRVKEREVR